MTGPVTTSQKDRAEHCSDCGTALTDENAFHPYGDCYAERCKDCDATSGTKKEEAMTTPETTIEVGEFTFNRETQSVSGPAEYMRDQGFAKIRAITTGTDPSFPIMAQCAPAGQEIERTILVALQTDYAGWHGMKTFCRQHGMEAR